ncbi:MAG: SPOR domain-containing protein [Nitrospiraceae bacterium]|nr:SPOR domain-containing protein [Nitrospiraceae bacterium]
MTKNVLVIEKEFDAARQIAKALEAEGYFVFTASSAEAGLVMARRVKPSLIFLDLPVKDAGGIEFLNRLRAVEFLRKVPILLLIEKEQEYEPGLRDLYGIVNFVRTPVNDAEVIAKSKATLEGISSGAQDNGPFSSDEEELAGEESPAPHADNPDEDNIVRLSAEASNEAETHAAPPADFSADFSNPPEDVPDAGYEIPDEDMNGLAVEGYLAGGEYEPPPAAIHPEEAESRVEGQGEEAEIWRMDRSGLDRDDLDRDGLDRAGRPEQDQLAGPEISSGAKTTADAGADARGSGFAARIERAMSSQKNLFGEKDMATPSSGEEKKIEGKKKGAGSGMEEEKTDGQTGGGLPPINEDEGGLPPVNERTKNKKSTRKSLVLVLAVVLLGAAASFVFFMHFPPGKKASPFVRTSEGQPVIIEQNTPAFVATSDAPDAQPSANAPSAGQPLAAQPLAAQPAAGAQRPERLVKPETPVKPGKLVRHEKIARARGGKNGKIKIGARHPAHGFQASQASQASPRRRAHSLQVGAFLSRANALKLAGKLKSEGFHAYIGKSSKNGKPLYRVLVGKFRSLRDERTGFEKLKKRGFKPFPFQR